MLQTEINFHVFPKSDTDTKYERELLITGLEEQIQFKTAVEAEKNYSFFVKIRISAQ